MRGGVLDTGQRACSAGMQSRAAQTMCPGSCVCSTCLLWAAQQTFPPDVELGQLRRRPGLRGRAGASGWLAAVLHVLQLPGAQTSTLPDCTRRPQSSMAHLIPVNAVAVDKVGRDPLHWLGLHAQRALRLSGH